MSIEITSKDLPLTCPKPGANLWNAHPKVTLALDEHGEAICPYCGTRYKLTGELPAAHH